MIARVVSDGEAEGPVISSTTPLSLWGGLDPVTGTVIDRQHPLHGRAVNGRILVLPAGRGSSAASAVLLETLLNGQGPAGVVLGGADDVLAVGVIVADEVFDAGIPMLIVDEVQFPRVASAAAVRIAPGGVIRLDEEVGLDARS